MNQITMIGLVCPSQICSITRDDYDDDDDDWMKLVKYASDLSRCHCLFDLSLSYLYDTRYLF